MKTICGSPLYMAPELFLNNSYNDNADLWSLGVIFYQLLIGNVPINANTIEMLRFNLQNKDINFNINKNFTSECLDLLKNLLIKDHTKRISWINLINHKWFVYWQNNIDIFKNQNVDILNNSNKFEIIQINNNNKTNIQCNDNTMTTTLEMFKIGTSNLSRMKLSNNTTLNIKKQINNEKNFNKPTNAYTSRHYLNRIFLNSIEKSIDQTEIELGNDFNNENTNTSTRPIPIPIKKNLINILT